MESDRVNLATYKVGDRKIVIFRQRGKYHAELWRGKSGHELICSNWDTRPDQHPDWERVKAIAATHIQSENIKAPELLRWNIRANAKNKPLW